MDFLPIPPLSNFLLVWKVKPSEVHMDVCVGWNAFLFSQAGPCRVRIPVSQATAHAKSSDLSDLLPHPQGAAELFQVGCGTS